MARTLARAADITGKCQGEIRAIHWGLRLLGRARRYRRSGSPGTAAAAAQGARLAGGAPSNSNVTVLS